MSHSRRDFLKAASVAALSFAGRGFPLEALLPGLNLYPHVGDPALRELAAQALDAARAAGAEYADVRFTLQRYEDLRFYSASAYQHVRDQEFAGVGVRALVDGAWGFASSTLWSPDELARLSREAAEQARTNSRGGQRHIELAPPPPPASGEWRTPIRRDPFDVPLVEKLETAWAFIEHATRFNVGGRNANVRAGMTMKWERLEKTFASTEGAFVGQVHHRADPGLSVGVQTPRGRAGRSSDLLRLQPGGWEVLSEARIVDELPRLVEEALLMVDAERIMPDRYEVVLDARAMAQLVAHTIGTATELDRVLGYEANAGGTSYLAPPDEMLGSFELGPEILNVRAERSDPRGLATARWDDEGVEPESYDLIRDGVLVDYQTTRELASELAGSYANGNPVRSRGGASSEDALSVTMLHPANLEVVPGTEEADVDELASRMKKGLVICGGRVTVDRQQLNGELNGEMVYEVRDGRRTRFVHSAEALFRSPELWQNLKALGGAAEREWFGATVSKGQPAQQCVFGVAAVPAHFENVAVTDRMRKA